MDAPPVVHWTEDGETRYVLTADGHLDRKKLGDLVFRDAEARAALNAITPWGG